MSVITVFIYFRLKGELDLAFLYTFCGIWFILRYFVNRYFLVNQAKM